MPTAFGSIAERITGARFWFVPDGSDISDDETPELTGPTAKPADDADWADYNIGQITQAAYDPTFTEREREFFSNELLRYVKRTDKVIDEDAFNLTMIEYASTVFDRIMFGLASDPEDDTEQQIFVATKRERDGWGRMIRYNEDKSVLCQLEFHLRLTIQENPADSSEPGSPVWRIAHLGDATPALETIIFNPAAA